MIVDCCCVLSPHVIIFLARHPLEFSHLLIHQFGFQSQNLLIIIFHWHSALFLPHMTIHRRNETENPVNEEIYQRSWNIRDHLVPFQFWFSLPRRRDIKVPRPKKNLKIFSIHQWLLEDSMFLWLQDMEIKKLVKKLLLRRSHDSSVGYLKLKKRNVF